MPVLPLTLIKGDRVSDNVDYRDALPVNMYAVQRNILGAKGYMLCYPGLSLLGSGLGRDRGGVYNERQDNHYRVSGNDFITVDSDGTVTSLGTVTGGNQASMPYSFNTQAVVSDGKYWLYNATNGFRQVTDADLGNPIDATWINGYYFFTDGEFIFHTDISDESSIDPLKFATAEFMPDPSLAVAKSQDNKVIVFGRYSVEYFVDRANENFAFSRVETRAQKIGIVATHAKCEVAGNWFFCGSRKNESLGIHILTIGASKKVSTREVDQILDSYTETELSDMRLECHMEDNVYFITVHLPNETLLYNATIGSSFGDDVAWSILKTGNSDGPYRAINGVFDPRLGAWVYGDRFSSNIGKLDKTKFTQYGQKQEWLLYTPFVDIESASIDELEIETIPGFNDTDDATVTFSITENGITYSSEWWTLYSEPLDYNKRFIQRRLGDVPDWFAFRFRALTSSRMAFAIITITYG